MPGHPAGGLADRVAAAGQPATVGAFPQGKEHDGGASEVVHAQDSRHFAPQARGALQRSADRADSRLVALDGAGVSAALP